MMMNDGGGGGGGGDGQPDFDCPGWRLAAGAIAAVVEQTHNMIRIMWEKRICHSVSVSSAVSPYGWFSSERMMDACFRLVACAICHANFPGASSRSTRIMFALLDNKVRQHSSSCSFL